MNSFTKKELILSLLFPFLTFLWGVGNVITPIFFEGSIKDSFVYTGTYFPNVTWVVAILIGGILPAVLTLTLKVHTEQYLKKRLCVLALIIVVFQIVNHVMSAFLVEIYMIILCAGAIVYQVLKVQAEETSGGERAILMLSDPGLYWLIYETLSLLDTLLIG